MPDGNHSVVGWANGFIVNPTLIDDNAGLRKTCSLMAASRIAGALIDIHKYFKARHPGRESTARFGLDPEHRDVKNKIKLASNHCVDLCNLTLPSMATGSRQSLPG